MIIDIYFNIDYLEYLKMPGLPFT